MNMGTPDPIANQGKILKSHGIERVKSGVHMHLILEKYGNCSWSKQNPLPVITHILIYFVMSCIHDICSNSKSSVA